MLAYLTLTEAQYLAMSEADYLAMTETGFVAGSGTPTSPAASASGSGTLTISGSGAAGASAASVSARENITMLTASLSKYKVTLKWSGLGSDEVQIKYSHDGTTWTDAGSPVAATDGTWTEARRPGNTHYRAYQITESEETGTYLQTRAPLIAIAPASYTYDNIPDEIESGVFEVFASNPTDIGTPRAVRTLFLQGGPTEDDVFQDGPGNDCTVCGGGKGIARQRRDVIPLLVYDNGNNDYVVTLYNPSDNEWQGWWIIHVNGDLPTWATSADCDWAYIVEKAAMFLLGWMQDEETNSYMTSINGGDPTFSLQVLGMINATAEALSADATIGTKRLNKLTGCAAVVTFGTASSPPDIQGSHAYTVFSGEVLFVNPWGVDGAGGTGGDDGNLLYTYANFRANVNTAQIAVAVAA